MVGIKFKKIYLLVILLFLNISIVYSIFPLASVLSWAVTVKDGTWYIQAADTAVPGAGRLMGFIANPQGSVFGEGVGAIKQALPSGLGNVFGKVTDAVTGNIESVITQTALEDIAKTNPEASGALSSILNVKGQLQELGFSKGDINFDKEGKLTSVSEFDVKKDKLYNINKIVG